MTFVLCRSRILAVIWVIRMEKVRSCGMQLFIGFLFQLLLGVFIVGLSSFLLDWKASLFWEFSVLWKLTFSIENELYLKLLQVKHLRGY